jgi:deoxyguanosine kinase
MTDAVPHPPASPVRTIRDNHINNNNEITDNSPFIVSLEGNIGAGKSTLLRRIDAALEAAGIPHVVLYEPVDQWSDTRVDDGSGRGPRGMLELFYDDMRANAFVFQIFVLQTRVQQMLDCVRANPGKVIVTERCHVSDCHIFAKLMSESGNLSPAEMLVYMKWYDTCGTILQDYLKGIAYLRASPSVCVDRIIKRSRAGEENITLENLTKLHAAHESWIMGGQHGVPVTVIDGNVGEDKTDVEAIVSLVRQGMMQQTNNQ